MRQSLDAGAEIEGPQDFPALHGACYTGQIGKRAILVDLRLARPARRELD